MLLFTTLHPFVSCLSDIVRSSYRLLQSSSSLIPDIAAFALVSPSSFSSCVVLSFLRLLSASRTSLVPCFVVYPHRRLHLILRPPLSTVSLLRRTYVVDNVSAQPLSSSSSSNIGSQIKPLSSFPASQYRTICVHRHHAIVSSPLSSPKHERSHRRIALSMIVSSSSVVNDTPPDSAAQRTLRAGVSSLRHRRLHYRRHPRETCTVVFRQSLRLAYRRNFVT